MSPPFTPGSAIFGFAVAAVLTAPPAQAQTPGARPPSPDTAVSGVTVTARSDLSGLVVNGRLRCTLPVPPNEKADKPRVVDTWPKQGATVPPGLIYLRVTYSEKMSPCGFLLASTLTGGEYPDFAEEPALLRRDFKSFYFAIRTQPGKEYGVSFNALLASAHFRSLYDVGAPSYGLHFHTSAEPPVTARAAALDADPGSEGVSASFDRLLKLWTPRGDAADDEASEGDAGTPDLPLCGRCVGNVLTGPEDRPPAGPAPIAPPAP